MTTKQDERLTEVGTNAMASIRDMVAALECDYERLEELQEERADLAAACEEDGPEDASTAGKREELAAWDEENGEELKELEEAAGDCKDEEEARERILEDALSLEYRSGWVSSKEDMEPEEYCLLLTTGGPAVRIIGEVRDGEAHSARLEVQDWFTPWTEHITTGADHDALLTYARCFCME